MNHLDSIELLPEHLSVSTGKEKGDDIFIYSTCVVAKCPLILQITCKSVLRTGQRRDEAESLDYAEAHRRTCRVRRLVIIRAHRKPYSFIYDEQGTQ